MNATENAIETWDLTKVYDKRIRAVDRLNLTVRRGEVYGFLGPNGAGKTTTLQMLLGLVRATSGTATVLGKPRGPRDLHRCGRHARRFRRVRPVMAEERRVAVLVEPERIYGSS
jgi:ABC-type multidrug transport system ATPase subunit